MMTKSQYPKVQILLSTYNGGEFIEELVSSILNQSGVEVQLLIRDDGSTDKSPDILETATKTYANVTIIKGDNVGVVGSFFELLRLSGGADYYAFADQDDIWKPDKLISAVQMMDGFKPDEPLMYYSRLEFVNKHLEHIGYSAKPVFSGFRNALVQNQATGCTIVLNDTARAKIVEKLPNWALMHDWWCYLVTSAFGTVMYDENTYILYRKHGKNVTPATPFFGFELLARVKRYLGDGRITEKVTDQVLEFKRLFYDELQPEKKSLTDEFLSARNSNFIRRLIYIVFEQRVKRNTPLDNLILKILILFGKF